MIMVVSVKGLNTAEKRAQVCYVGRAFAGWPESPLGNQYKGANAVPNFAKWLTDHPDRVALLSAVWEECERGKKPLGCWCVGTLKWPWYVNLIDEPVCHAQVIALQIIELIESGVLPT